MGDCLSGCRHGVRPGCGVRVGVEPFPVKEECCAFQPQGFVVRLVAGKEDIFDRSVAVFHERYGLCCGGITQQGPA